ncbi:putative quinol monooxygenase [Halobaculum gomorrense]|uniref:Quinol monooxygenase YgiN n=1 Tax=Halobaculum gomorrense TaxID=43928 RepID=A0A1M5PJ56_9EURY|nr:putative quinol monooxygenase [Halobaculum gomorrense]SHH01771.1 Quinol monooxygenase YgiN [Halobaculum gomorrense]
MIVVHATFPVDTDSRTEAADLFAEVAEQSRREDGVIDYRVGVDVDDDTVFRFVEEYEDESAFDSHTETPHFGKLAERLPDLLAGEPDVTRFDVESATDVEL